MRLLIGRILWGIVMLCSIAASKEPSTGSRVRPGPLQSEDTVVGKAWVCTPCGLPCDTMVFSAPGTCPRCGMPLVEQSTVREEVASTKKVAILIFNGVEIIDYTGPWEVFGAAGFDVFTVAASKDPVTTAMGMTVVPKYTFTDAPRPDVLLVPGGGVHDPLNSPPTMKWVTDMSALADQTISVCNGAFILAQAGLLDGITATTTNHLIDQLQQEYPKINVVHDQRYVDNGKITTTAGLSAGIDGAFHLVSKLMGNGIAQTTALGLEYKWEPQGSYVRASLADRYLPEFKGFEARVLSIGGDEKHWEVQALISSPRTADEIAKLTAQELVSDTHHTKTPVTVSRRNAAAASDWVELEWKFTDDRGRQWNGAGVVKPSPDAKGKYLATLRLDCASK